MRNFIIMGKLVELAIFDNVYDVRYNLLKDMLEEAGIGFVTTNEQSKVIIPTVFMRPDNMAIGIKVDEENLEDAMEILRSIS